MRRALLSTMLRLLHPSQPSWKTNLRKPLQVKARGEPAAEDVSIAAHLLRLRDPETGEPLSDDALVGEFGIFFAAGIETAGNAMAWTMWDLFLRC